MGSRPDLAHPRFCPGRLAPVHRSRHGAGFFGVSVRTLQDWEQGRRNPTGAARSLLLLAVKRPKVLREVLKELAEAA